VSAVFDDLLESKNLVFAHQVQAYFLLMTSLVAILVLLIQVAQATLLILASVSFLVDLRFAAHLPQQVVALGSNQVSNVLVARFIIAGSL